jgi:hypothetical protein
MRLSPLLKITLVFEIISIKKTLKTPFNPSIGGMQFQGVYQRLGKFRWRAGASQ